MNFVEPTKTLYSFVGLPDFAPLNDVKERILHFETAPEFAGLRSRDGDNCFENIFAILGDMSTKQWYDLILEAQLRGEKLLTPIADPTERDQISRVADAIGIRLAKKSETVLQIVERNDDPTTPPQQADTSQEIQLAESRIVFSTIRCEAQVSDYGGKRIFTPDNNELRKMAREFDQKLIPLQTSDFGRWIGTQPNSVATFIKLDTEIIDLNDEALDLRRQRLRSSVDALRRFQPQTQGAFNPSTSAPVLAILQDVNWVEEQYRKLTNRLALIGDLETRFPRDQDWTGLPTLRERKQEQIASMFERIKSAEHKARQRASEETADRIEKSVFDREVQKTETQIAGEEALAKFERKLMEAEFGRQLSEVDKRIMATQLKTARIKSDIVKMKADTTKDLLVVYLESDRVRALLQPFCSDGLEEAHQGAGHKRIDSLTAGPMSYSRISANGCLAEHHKSMRNLIRIANNSRNDRPGWGVDEHSYAQVGDNFENIDGELVNCYIEAQRILRVHGPTLVELEMLRK